MAIINAGILGSVSGTIGNVVGSSRNGVNYIRIKSTKVRNPQTEGQMVQRAKFGMVQQFLSPLTEVVKVGFKNNSSGMEPINYASSYNLQNAIKGVYPEFEMNAEALLLSQGSLCQVQGLQAELKDGAMKFTWTHNANNKFGAWSPNDKAMLVVYNVTRGQVGVSFGEFTRVSSTGSIELPDHFAGDTLWAFAFFVSETGNVVSTSQYVGQFVMAIGQ